LKPEDITDAYYHLGAIDAEGNVHTPHLTRDDGTRTSFEIRCHVCNTGLCKLMTIAKSPVVRQNMIWVEPCPKCLKAAQENGEVTPISLNKDWKGK